MAFLIVGLGNPGVDYEGTRHNTGQMTLERLRKTHDFPLWKLDAKRNALVSSGVLGKEKVTLVLPQGFMNNSGKSLRELVGSGRKAEKCLVVYDELDVPLGTFKISFGRGSGGHNGIESIIRTIKTRDFPRVRIGISPTTPSGKLKKPSGEKEVVAHILGKFKPNELEVLKKVEKKVVEAIEVLVTQGRAIAMNEFN